MTEQEFSHLCHALAVELQLPDSESLEEQGKFMINGYRIGIFMDQESDLIDCYLDVGFVDEKLRNDLFSDLMEINLEINGLHGEAFGFDADTGHLMLRAAVRTDLGCDSAAFAELLEGYAKLASEISAACLSVESLALNGRVGVLA